MHRVFLALLIGAANTAAADIPLPDARLFPEGIAALDDGTLFIGSVNRGSILRRAPDGTITTFVPAGAQGLMSVIGIHTDPARDLLWACSSDFGVGDRSGRDTVALHAFALDDGRPQGRYALSGGQSCNDMTIDEAGAIYVTDSLTPTIFKLAPGETTAKPWLRDERFGGEGFALNGITLIGTDMLFVVKYNDGTLFRIRINGDGSPGDITLIPTARPLVLGDGLTALDDRRLLLVEGEGRLTELTIDGDVARTATLGDGMIGPTTVAVVADTAYVVEGQLNALVDPQGNPAGPTPFRLITVDLP